MKKISSIIILIFLICIISSCSTTPNSSHSNPYIGNDNEESIGFTFPVEYIQLEHSFAQKLNISPLHYTEVLGVRKRYEKSLPVIIGFQNPYLFYERMSAVMEDSEEDNSKMYVGRYSIESNQLEEFVLNNFRATTDEATVMIDKDHIVYMYVSSDEKTGPTMNILLLDFKNRQQKLLGSYSVYNVFGYAKKLNDTSLIFMLYESVQTGTQQIVLRYDFQTDRMQEIYRGPTMGGYHTNSVSTKDIWAIDTNDDKIDMLMQQFENGKMHLYLRTIDRNGKTLSEIELEDLSMYHSVKDVSDSLVTKDCYTIVHFSQFDKDEDNKNHPSSILYRTGDSYQLINTNLTDSMNTLLSMDDPDDPFLFFSSHQDKNQIFLIDTFTHKGYQITTDLSDVQTISADADGNILIQVRENEESNLYLFSNEYTAQFFK